MDEKGIIPINSVSSELLKKIKRANEFVKHSKATSTRVAYAHDWGLFEKWCLANNLSPLPADAATVAVFLSDQAKEGFKISTMNRRMAAIKFAHKIKGLSFVNDKGIIESVFSGIKRKVGCILIKKTPLVAPLFSKLLEQVPKDTVKGKRDRALLLIGFGGALRRSELVALHMKDITIEDEGIRLLLRKSKTDQKGFGQEIVIPRERHNQSVCPVKALQDWLLISRIKSGPLFYCVHKWGTLRSTQLRDQSVRLIIKYYASLAGIDDKSFSAHSLRSGWITSAAERNASIFKIQEVSRHKSLSVLSDYVRSANKYKDHAGAGLL